MKTKLSFCERCCNIAETGGLCPICADERRDQTTICVVENPPDVVAVERSGAFHGTYHVLHGVSIHSKASRRTDCGSKS